MHCAHRSLMIGGRSDHSDLSLSDQFLKLFMLGLTSQLQVTKKGHFCRGWVGGPGQVTFEGDLGGVGGWSGQRLPR